MTTQVYRGTMSSPLGAITVFATDEGVLAVTFASEPEGRHGVSEEVSEDATHSLVAATIEQLKEYFGGERTGFDLPLSPRGTEFQQLAWDALCEIPFGETRSYGQQARAIDRPSAVRAIGAANGANPIAIIVPCHRVIGSDGKLTGYAGGLHIKKALLEHEGVLLEPAQLPFGEANSSAHA